MGLSDKQANDQLALSQSCYESKPIPQVSVFGGSHLVEIIVLTVTHYIIFQVQNIRV